MSFCSPVSFPSQSAVNVICGFLCASLRVNDLEGGSSRCVVLGFAVLTPCEFERRAGRGNTRNWKISIRYSGRPLKDCLESDVGCDGKKRVRFVFPDFPSQGDGSACFILPATGGSSKINRPFPSLYPLLQDSCTNQL